ncbi:histidine phosphatase family protein [Cellulomonas alba]|uniref:Histidine phosphatase family protein n=1 Tax=Cellulomonas alba TaxID=3053467 RepID=A0ABT7SKH0_9CELL|nr:histidine phosphatase family protein [Cellulomonas alba]MDM7856019.1 histidine phosphatase family protein [Cellulomonas alba]
MRVALIRHGQTDWNIQRRYQGWHGLDLNEIGRAQAQEAGGRLVAAGSATGADWRWLASSTSPRAVQTAEIVGEVAGLELREQVRDLIERGFGVAEGMLIDEARTRWPDRDYEGGESTAQVLARSLAALDALAAQHAGTDGVVVSHGTVLRLIVGELTGTDPGSLPNGAIAVLDGGPGAWRVEVHPVPSA